MFRKARDLSVGDVFRLHVYGRVLEVAPVANGKRIRVKLEFEDQGRRDNSGFLTFSRSLNRPLEFTDAGHVLEFLCRPSRAFHVIEWWDDGDSDDRGDSPVLSPEGADSGGVL